MAEELARQKFSKNQAAVRWDFSSPIFVAVYLFHWYNDINA
jgi:hypothetical protein